MLADLPTDPDSAAWLAVFGRCHILVLHLPIGLVPALALLEFGSAIFRRPHPRGAILTVAWLCALAGATAAASGFVLAQEGGYGADLLSWHKISGIGLGVLCVLCALTAGQQKRAAFRVVLLLACALAVPTGHLGGSMTHGSDFLLEPLHPKGTATTDGTPPTGPESAGPVATGEFATKVLPLLTERCGKCHNPDKQKGKLVLTTKDGILAGGENGVVLVPGKPDDSSLLTNLLLPLADDDHMPPEGKPQPTAEEIALLRAWIAAGAKFD